MAIHATDPGRSGAEPVIEDLKAEKAAIICGCQRIHDPGKVKIPLPRHAAPMPAPGEVIHLQFWRIGQLDQEDPITGKARIGARSRLRDWIGNCPAPRRHSPGQRGAPLPRHLEIMDQRRPGQGLIAHPHATPAARSPSSAKSAAIRSIPPCASGETEEQTTGDHCPVPAAVEFAFRPVKRLGAPRLRQTFKIPERLAGDDVKPEIAAHPPDIPR